MSKAIASLFPLFESKVDTGTSTVEIVRASQSQKLTLLSEVTVSARARTPKFSGDLYFFGGPSGASAEELNGKVVVMLGVPRIRTKGSPSPLTVPGTPPPF